MAFDVRSTDLSKLNSLTKYPSIPTYHTLDPRNGALGEEALPFAGMVLGTEKIDGTNARVICLPDGSYLLGSREELLYARGDLIGNPAQGIVEALKAQAERLCATVDLAVVVYYFEVYGGKVSSASKQYTGEQRVGYRLFDVARLPDYETHLARSQPEIAAWREAGGQPFADETALREVADRQGVALTPRILEIAAEDLPQTVEAALAFLRKALPQTRCALDDGAGHRGEGLVIRMLDRSRIAKLRFEDYERTLRKRR
jgi:RNA ligase